MPVSHLLLETGDVLATEGGDQITLDESATEAFQYCELWDKSQAMGGVRLAYLGVPIGMRRRMRLNGDDAFEFSLHKTRWCIPLIRKGAVVRELLSLDGTLWREWPIDTFTRTSGAEPLVTVICHPPYHLLTNYPIETTDADGYVYQDTSAIQLTPAAVITAWIRARTPSWIVNGTIEPTAPVDVPFSRESALQGLRRLEELTGKEASLTPIGTTQYGINLTTIGAGAPILYLRTLKNLQAVQKQVIAGQVNRLNVITGADGDDGPASIAWAYWEVEATSGAGPYRIKLKSIHAGGDGPIKYDGQLSHANLPGGANSLYLETAETGTLRQITGSFVATQEIEVASLTGISIGSWHRIVASSTGKHLNFLDAPAEIAANGEQGGQFESAYDDALCVARNPLQALWPGVVPEGWTSVGGKTTTPGEWITSGQALSINQSVADGGVISAVAPRTWFIKNRKSFWSATAWIRLRAATSVGDITFRFKANGVVVGTGLVYQSPLNAWVQLKISGLDLGAYVNTAAILEAEIVKSNGTGTVNMLVDDICFGPSLSAKAPTEGSNAARIWQEANRFLDDSRGDQIAWKASAADLARMGLPNQVSVIIGQTVVIDDWELGTVTNRLVEKTDNPADAKDFDCVISTLEPRRSREQAKPLALVIPFFEPIAVQVATEDRRNAAILLRVASVADLGATISVMLEVADSKGALVTVSAVAFGATYVSGSGAGPWVFAKPTSGAGIGRVIFTGKVAGRTDAEDAIDVSEQSAGVIYSEVRTTQTDETANTVEYTVTGDSPIGTPTVELVSISGTATLNAGPAIGVSSPSGTAWTFNRGSGGLGSAKFRAVLAGTISDEDNVPVTDVGNNTVPVQGRARAISSTDLQIVVRVSMADPFPQGANTGTISWIALLGSGGTIGPASGQLVTPAATLTEAAGTYVDFTITRPNAGQGDGQVIFGFAAAGRISDTDPLIVTARPANSPTWSVAQTAEGDTSVTVTVTITSDPESRVTGVEFATQTGQAAVSGFALDSSPPYAQTVTLTEGQTSKLFYRIMGLFRDGTAGKLAEDFVTIKSSAMPTPPIMTLLMDTAGNVTARIEGDDLTASIKVSSSLSAMPADATVDGATAVNFRQLTTATLQTVNAANPSCYVKAVAHSQINGGGLKSIYVQGILTYTKVVTKTIRVPYGEFVPAVETYPFSFGLFGLHTNNSSGTEYGYVAPVVLPKGVTITNVSFRWGRATASEVIKVKFYQTIDATPTLLVSQDPVSGTGPNTTSLGLGPAQLVGDENYVAVVLMSATSGLAAATLFWVEVTYQTPSYEVTY